MYFSPSSSSHPRLASPLIWLGLVSLTPRSFLALPSSIPHLLSPSLRRAFHSFRYSLFSLLPPVSSPFLWQPFVLSLVLSFLSSLSCPSLSFLIFSPSPSVPSPVIHHPRASPRSRRKRGNKYLDKQKRRENDAPLAALSPAPLPPQRKQKDKK